MLFTPSERRLLCLLTILLGIGYLQAALCHFRILPLSWCRGCREDQRLVPVLRGPAPDSGDAILPQPVFREGYLDLNLADSASLCALPGIGPTLAGRILARRRAEPFRALPELREIRGIGPHKFEQIQRLLIVADSVPMARGGRRAGIASKPTRGSGGSPGECRMQAPASTDADLHGWPR
jgi:hypothetical protein